MLSPVLLRRLRLGRARDLGDAFATAGGCLDAGWGPRAPPQAEMGTQSDVHLLGATLISPSPSPRPRAALTPTRGG